MHQEDNWSAAPTSLGCCRDEDFTNGNSVETVRFLVFLHTPKNLRVAGFMYRVVTCDMVYSDWILVEILAAFWLEAHSSTGHIGTSEIIEFLRIPLGKGVRSLEMPKLKWLERGQCYTLFLEQISPREFDSRHVFFVWLFGFSLILMGNIPTNK